MRILLVLFTILFATSVAAQGNYNIRPGDTLRIEVLEDPSLNRNVLVLPDGQISFPLAGSIQATGMSTSQVERSITSRIAENFATEPNVFVAVSNIPQQAEGPLDAEPTIDVYFLGEVRTPGLRAIAPGSTILQALSQSGGLTEFAATKRIQLRRQFDSREYVYRINYKALSDGATIEGNISLSDGDVILVPERRLFE